MSSNAVIIHTHIIFKNVQELITKVEIGEKLAVLGFLMSCLEEKLQLSLLKTYWIAVLFLVLESTKMLKNCRTVYIPKKIKI